MPERELKEQIIFALAQQGGEDSVDKMLEIAREEEDSELRKKAIFWLSQSDDPRVAEFLLEIIEGRQ
jgi:HEAT repeat protein